MNKAITQYKAATSQGKLLFDRPAAQKDKIVESLDGSIPTRQQKRLHQAIGKRLTEITRWFVLEPDTFLEDDRRTSEDFFGYNTGITSIQFTEGVKHSYDVHGEQLSLALLSDPVTGDEFEKPYTLSKYEPAPELLKAYLGKTCRDVRIWKCKEALLGGEFGEAGVSYLFEDGSELFYCIYLHDELDSDFLLQRAQISPDEVVGGYSLVEGKEILF